MDFKLQFGQLLFSQPWIQLLLGLVSIVFAELIRDSYHLAGHYWQPLQRSHWLHHKVYRPDLTVTSLEAYRKAQWHNDVPESLAMVLATALIASLSPNPGLWLGCLYSWLFLIPAVARSQGLLLQTDFSHKPGRLITIPSQWTVNRSYHWRHHFDQTDAYFCGHLPLMDKLLGTSLALKGKVIAVTGASGTMGRALIAELTRQGAKPIALTTNSTAEFAPGVKVWQWQPGAERDLIPGLSGVDILVINHGVNPQGDRSAVAVHQAYEINTFSAVRLADLFLETVTESSHTATKELWINTSEAEVNPTFSPLYEMSKRTLGDVITLRRLDAPCIIRKLVLGPFKSQLNPVGVMSPDGVAWAIVALAKRDVRNIIVTINPITYVIFPVKEFFQSVYFRLCTRRSS